MHINQLRARVRHSALAACLALPACSLDGQQTPGAPFQSTTRHRIESAPLGETRIVDVTLPHRYAADTAARYPVIVALDGEFEGEIAASIARFYANMGSIPGVIVVAIHNTARTRDLTPAPIPPFTAPPGPSGGADRFLTFVADEVLPFIDRQWRAAPMRVLIGHSLGGLFALHTLAKRPDLFTGYVIMEPAAWWNDQQPARAAAEVLRTPAARQARVMLVNAQSLTTDTTAWGGARPMVRHIRILEESHASMAAIGMAAGLRRLFEDFRPPQWRPGTSPIEMLARYDSLAARVGYVVPIPVQTYETVVRMCLNARLFDDAERALVRMERARGVTEESRDLRERLVAERNRPAPAGWIPLVVPAKRPTPAQASRFLGRWRSVDGRRPHDVEVRASGDTIVVHDRIAFPDNEPFDADDPVITITDRGTLEWGLPFFRGLAALLVQVGTLEDDDTMVVRSEPRGWLPRDPNFPAGRVVRFKRVREHH